MPNYPSTAQVATDTTGGFQHVYRIFNPDTGKDVAFSVGYQHTENVLFGIERAGRHVADLQFDNDMDRPEWHNRTALAKEPTFQPRHVRIDPLCGKSVLDCDCF